MTQPGHNFKSTAIGNRSAFSLIEILVTVALLTVIILGLVAMFNQTRRAFTSSITQVDVLESGRDAADLIGREMEQMAPAGSFNVTNFMVRQSPSYPSATPMTQQLVDPSDFRTNNLQEVVFVTRYNQQWNVIGYKTDLSPVNTRGIATLYRFNVNGIPVRDLVTLSNQLTVFRNTIPPATNFSRIIDGVVDFRVGAADLNGRSFITNNALTLPSSTIFIQTNIFTGDYTFAQFSNNSLPASVEVELGILEDRALARYVAIAGTNAALQGSSGWAYLTNHAGQVHIFRQRITIRNVNPAAF